MGVAAQTLFENRRAAVARRRPGMSERELTKSPRPSRPHSKRAVVTTFRAAMVAQ